MISIERMTGQQQFDKESAGQLMFFGMMFSSEIIFGDKWNMYKQRKGATFELLILSTLLILRKFNDLKPDYYTQFEEDLFKHLYLFAKEENVINKIPSEFDDFVNSRFVLYDNEFTLDENGNIKFPLRTIYNLFENPLEEEGGISEDLLKMVEFQIKYKYFYESLMRSLDFVISLKYN